ncbi:MAG: kynurenine 3-monooxygenase [Cyanobacteria bacterium PR.3.49]|jgi:kynurenine 3-monooxygenase|nr:kynurenine 3-monooxygenase [Cyanobacteria bacterium PR.3.49]
MSADKLTKKLSETHVCIVGAGLTGSLMAVFLARHGMRVTILERRPDMRAESISAGRSINLNITRRGLRALERAGLEAEILKQSVPMMGRLMHSRSGETTYQPYGRDESEFGNSVSRGELNKTLMTAAEKAGNVTIRFNQRVAHINLETNTLTIQNEAEKNRYEEKFDLIIGTDGSASQIRHCMSEIADAQCDTDTLNYGYKELTILPLEGGKFALEKNVLHIWPRGLYMIIALPNFDGSFTCTLFLPYEPINGSPSFAKLKDERVVGEFFKVDFFDAYGSFDRPEKTFFENPTGSMVTVTCDPWHYKDRVLLVGDAAHAIVPFFGQGANCAFEDLTVFEELMNKHVKDDTVDWLNLFKEFNKLRKPNADAIAQMAFENFIEMRDKVGQPEFLLQKAAEKVLEKNFPDKFASRYALVTFTHTPYEVCRDAGVIIDKIVAELCKNIKSADELDLKKAEQLIDAKLAPLLKGRVRDTALSST